MTSEGNTTAGSGFSPCSASVHVDYVSTTLSYVNNINENQLEITQRPNYIFSVSAFVRFFLSLICIRLLQTAIA